MIIEYKTGKVYLKKRHIGKVLEDMIRIGTKEDIVMIWHIVIILVKINQEIFVICEKEKNHMDKIQHE